MDNLQELQAKLKQRAYERRIFAERLEGSDEEFNRIKSKFTRGKYDVNVDLIRW